MPDLSDLDQSFFQVRLDWGAAGLERLAGTDVVILVDVLPDTGPSAAPAGEGLDALGTQAASAGALVLRADLRRAAATARAVLEAQHQAGRAVSIAVIAVGAHEGGRLRFTVEDQLGAGAVVAALGAVGLDHSSPEAAVAAEAFRGLSRATRHMLSASGGGKRLIAAGERERVVAAADVDADPDALVLADPRG